jgi:hypothetical protein
MSDNNDSTQTRKPHNYFDELSPERQEEHRRLDAMIAEAERYRKIGEAVDMFESLQRQLKREAKSKSKPKAEAERKPLLEEVMLARGLLYATRIQRGTIKNE